VTSPQRTEGAGERREMSSITQRKSDLRHIIHKAVERHLTEHPEEAYDAAMGAIRHLSGKMTLKELKQWHQVLYIKELAPAYSSPQPLDSGGD